MEFKSAYLQNVYATVEKKDPHQPEFLQAVGEVLESLQPVVEKRPELEKAGVDVYKRQIWSVSPTTAPTWPCSLSVRPLPSVNICPTPILTSNISMPAEIRCV